MAWEGPAAAHTSAGKPALVVGLKVLGGGRLAGGDECSQTLARNHAPAKRGVNAAASDGLGSAAGRRFGHPVVSKSSRFATGWHSSQAHQRGT